MLVEAKLQLQPCYPHRYLIAQEGKSNRPLLREAPSKQIVIGPFLTSDSTAIFKKNIAIESFLTSGPTAILEKLEKRPQKLLALMIIDFLNRESKERKTSMIGVRDPVAMILLVAPQSTFVTKGSPLDLALKEEVAAGNMISPQVVAHMNTDHLAELEPIKMICMIDMITKIEIHVHLRFMVITKADRLIPTIEVEVVAGDVPVRAIYRISPDGEIETSPSGSGMQTANHIGIRVVSIEGKEEVHDHLLCTAFILLTVDVSVNAFSAM